MLCGIKCTPVGLGVEEFILVTNSWCLLRTGSARKGAPNSWGKGFTFCALILLALLIVKEKLSSAACPTNASYLRKRCGSFCVRMLHKKKRLGGWKNCVSAQNSHREKFQRGVVLQSWRHALKFTHPEASLMKHIQNHCTICALTCKFFQSEILSAFLAKILFQTVNLSKDNTRVSGMGNPISIAQETWWLFPHSELDNPSPYAGGQISSLSMHPGPVGRCEPVDGLGTVSRPPEWLLSSSGNPTTQLSQFNSAEDLILNCAWFW